MLPLPEFSFNTTVKALQAKHDKITLHIGHRTFTGTVRRIDALRNYLAVPPQSIGSNAEGETFGRIFTRQHGTRANRFPLEIRNSEQGSSSTAPLALFDGEYEFSPYSLNPNANATIISTLKLSLNPIRFLRYQNPSTYVPPRRNFEDTNANLFRDCNVETEGENALDQSDNWIPNTAAYGRIHDGSAFGRSLRAYIESTIQEIDADIVSALQSSHVSPLNSQRITESDRFNLKEVETTFDFSCNGPCPIDRVISLESLLPSFNELDVTAHDYPVGIGGWRKNSRVFTVGIRYGVSLKIYAKTNRRIRIEVIHDLSKAHLKNDEGKKKRVTHTFSSAQEVCGLLSKLREDSAEIVNDLLLHFRSRASLPSTPKTTIDFLCDFLQAVGNRNNARELLSLLVNKGSIASQPSFTTALLHLREAGILQVQERNQKQEHVVTALYQYPLRMLTLHGSFPHLDRRRRNRVAATCP